MHGRSLIAMNICPCDSGFRCPIDMPWPSLADRYMITSLCDHVKFFNGLLGGCPRLCYGFCSEALAGEGGESAGDELCGTVGGAEEELSVVTDADGDAGNGAIAVLNFDRF